MLLSQIVTFNKPFQQPVQQKNAKPTTLQHLINTPPREEILEQTEALAKEDLATWPKNLLVSLYHKNGVGTHTEMGVGRTGFEPVIFAA